MKSLQRIVRAGALAAIYAISSYTSQAALVFNLGSVISGSTPGGPAPWLRATVEQDGATAVKIKMEAVSLVLNSSVTEAVKDWAFNINPSIAINSISASEVARVGSFNPNPVLLSTSVGGYGGFNFDFDFDFATAGGTAATRFTQGDSVTMRLTRAAGLTEDDFRYTADKNGASYYSGAHIISLAGGASAFVGASSVLDTTTPVPEPSTYVAAALLAFPVVAQIRRMRKTA
jgi:hypothetical protein